MHKNTSGGGDNYILPLLLLTTMIHDNWIVWPFNKIETLFYELSNIFALITYKQPFRPSNIQRLT